MQKIQKIDFYKPDSKDLIYRCSRSFITCYSPTKAELSKKRILIAEAPFDSGAEGLVYFCAKKGVREIKKYALKVFKKNPNPNQIKIHNHAANNGLALKTHLLYIQKGSEFKPCELLKLANCGNLKDYMMCNSLSIEQKKSLSVELITKVLMLHELGYVHLDIKPTKENGSRTILAIILETILIG